MIDAEAHIAERSTKPERFRRTDTVLKMNEGALDITGLHFNEKNIQFAAKLRPRNLSIRANDAYKVAVSLQAAAERPNEAGHFL